MKVVLSNKFKICIRARKMCGFKKIILTKRHVDHFTNTGYQIRKEQI